MWRWGNWAAARSLLQEAGQRGFSRIAVECIGCLLELNPVEEPLDVARYGVSGDAKRRAKCIDAFACHRARVGLSRLCSFRSFQCSGEIYFARSKSGEREYVAAPD